MTFRLRDAIMYVMAAGCLSFFRTQQLQTQTTKLTSFYRFETVIENELLLNINMRNVTPTSNANPFKVYIQVYTYFYIFVSFWKFYKKSRLIQINGIISNWNVNDTHNNVDDGYSSGGDDNDDIIEKE